MAGGSEMLIPGAARATIGHRHPRIPAASRARRLLSRVASKYPENRRRNSGMQLSWQAAETYRSWKRTIALAQCVCLLMAGSALGAETQVLSVSPSETKQLRKLLKGKRIDAILADGTNLVGRVKKVRDGLILVDIQQSADPNGAMPDLREIRSDRIATVHFTRHKGKWRAVLTALFSVGGLFLGAGIIGDCEGCEDGEPLALAVIWGGMTVLGYVLGMKKDKKAVTLMIGQAGTPGRPLRSERLP